MEPILLPFGIILTPGLQILGLAIIGCFFLGKLIPTVIMWKRLFGDEPWHLRLALLALAPMSAFVFAMTTGLAFASCAVLIAKGWL